MKINKSKIFRITISIFAILFVFLTTVFLYFFVPSLKTSLDMTKFESNIQQTAVYDKNEKQLNISDYEKNQYVSIEKIPPHVINSFVCLEDKRFFEHNGVDLYRICGAMLENLKSMKFKEGASTITQQLIKNTCLSSEKNLTRKFSEIRLALQLEEKMTKEQILELYLNSICFGNNCFGLSRASSFYFDKTVDKLSVAEGAMLAGIISAPNAYAPNKNLQKCIERRNIALSALFENKKITLEEFEKAKCEKIDINKVGLKDEIAKTYFDMMFNQAADIFGISPSQVKKLDLKIFTYFDHEKQKSLQESLKNKKIETKSGKNAQKMAISINNQSCGVEAFYANTNSNPYTLKRQIGSVAKPFVCLAPAFEENLITPSTMILDEKTNFGGYSPSNSGEVYDGWITIRKAIAESKNIPAVKLLNSLDKNKLKTMLKAIDFIGDDEITMNMALGSFEVGFAINQVADGYLMLANGGKFVKSSFIKRIEDKNGNILYENKPMPKNILREDTAFLTTDVLRDVIKYGTAKRLGTSFDVAGKTGTVGKKGCANNSDALFGSYTSQDTTLFWVFSDYDDLLSCGINGSTSPVEMAKSYYNKLYLKNKPKKMEIPSSIMSLEIDKKRLYEGKIELANEFLNGDEVVKEYFSVFNLPKQKSERKISIEEKFNYRMEELFFPNKNFYLEIKTFI